MVYNFQKYPYTRPPNVVGSGIMRPEKLRHAEEQENLILKMSNYHGKIDIDSSGTIPSFIRSVIFGIQTSILATLTLNFVVLFSPSESMQKYYIKVFRDRFISHSLN
jgi:hypothetical protein